jgi:UDP:flavonoid glycosyltransferase YjiC (YdhE family)
MTGSAGASRHIILTPVGSSGDVNPFVAIGRALRARGHDVTVLAPDLFESIISGAGLRFVSTGSTEEFERITGDPDLWHPHRGVQLMFKLMSERLRDAYTILEATYEPGRSLLVGHTLAFSTRVFEEVHRAPAVTVQLAPSTLRSDFRQPALPPVRDISRWPRPFKRALWWGVDRFAIDRHILPTLNPWRAELGLQPVSRVLKDWMNSPQHVLGLFPEWFGDPQPDWPTQLRLTGFVTGDGSGKETLTDDVRRFIASGSPPIVFTPGSANRQASQFFRAAAEATQTLGMRALLLTPFPEQLPDAPHGSILHVPYAPFSHLLPLCAAVVHHGGIGTCARGFRAGIPQLIMPMGFDQPDNALRVSRLGAGAFIPPNRFTGPAVAAALTRLLTDRNVAAACRRCKDSMEDEDGIGVACEHLERAAHR